MIFVWFDLIYISPNTLVFTHYSLLFCLMKTLVISTVITNTFKQLSKVLIVGWRKWYLTLEDSRNWDLPTCNLGLQVQVMVANWSLNMLQLLYFLLFWLVYSKNPCQHQPSVMLSSRYTVSAKEANLWVYLQEYYSKRLFPTCIW